MYVLDDPLRGGGLLEENGCITTVPEWREVGHVRGGGLSPCPLVVHGRRRENQRGRYIERTCEGHECMRQTYTNVVWHFSTAMWMHH